MFKFKIMLTDVLRRVFDGRSDANNNKIEEQLINTFYYRFRLREFKQVLDNVHVNSFLEFDECYLLADNYLIAMVFVYFIRSNLLISYYDARHFFSALFLAHEMEEDLEKLKNFIVPWFPWPTNNEKFAVLHEIKHLFWMNMDYNCLVTKNDCELVMKETAHWNIWKRVRSDKHHLNAIRTKVFPTCCANLLIKALNLDIKKCVIEKDLVPCSSDWEVGSNSPDILDR